MSPDQIKPDAVQAKAIYDGICAAKMTGKPVVYDPIPAFDQLTEYVYETGVSESTDGITVQLAKSKVTNVVSPLEPFGMPKELVIKNPLVEG